MRRRLKNLLLHIKTIKNSLISDIPTSKRNTNELVWAQVFNSSITGSSWLKNASFSPGRWAVGYPGLYILYRIYNDVKPASILEFGLGESSKLLLQYHKSHISEITIVDHNQEWVDYFSQAYDNVNDVVTLLPTTYKTIQGSKTLTYNNLEKILHPKCYNLIVIDGPYGSNTFSRSQIIDLVTNDCLAEDFIIVMDDYNRPGEVQTMNEVQILLKQKGYTFKTGIYSGQKDTFILCSPKYQYLCEL